MCVVVLGLMHDNESHKRQLYLISINGRRVQEGLPHTQGGERERQSEHKETVMERN